MDKIFRIELEIGNGPYNGYVEEFDLTLYDDNEFIWAERDHEDEEHPDPKNDGIELSLCYNEEYCCGFDSLNDLYQWFSYNELMYLYKLGFSIHVYEVDESDVEYGYRQCIFNKEKAMKLI